MRLLGAWLHSKGCQPDVKTGRYLFLILGSVSVPQAVQPYPVLCRALGDTGCQTFSACQLTDCPHLFLCQGEEPSTEKIVELLRKGTIGLKFVPVLSGSAFKNKGVQPLLDAVCAYLPSPLDVPPMKVGSALAPVLPIIPDMYEAGLQGTRVLPLSLKSLRRAQDAQLLLNGPASHSSSSCEEPVRIYDL